MCIRDSTGTYFPVGYRMGVNAAIGVMNFNKIRRMDITFIAVSYTHLRAHETVLDLVCRLLLEKKQHH